MTDKQILEAWDTCQWANTIKNAREDCIDCPFYGQSECSCKMEKAQHDLAVKLKTENAALRERLEKAVELPCKVGDKVYGVGFTDCEDSRTTDEKKKRQIFNVCMKMGGNCEKCKYRRPQIEEFVCTHIQLGDCGIEGKSILIVGDRNENYTANNVFTTSEAAEARLKELKGGKHE